MIQKLTIQNYRVIKELICELAPFTVLVGPNGCGKSTFLEALGICVTSFAHKNDQQTQANSFSNLMPPVGASATVEFVTDGRVYNHTVFADKDGSKSQKTKCNNSDATIEEILREKGAPKFVIHAQFQVSFLKETSPTAAPANLISMSGRGLAKLLAEWKLSDEDRFLSVKKSLFRIVPQIVDLGIDHPGDQYEYYVRLSSGIKVPSNKISDGTAFALGLIAAIISTNKRKGLILIDDIDHHFHPKAQGQMLQQLRELLLAYPDVQMVVTTHSPYLLGHLTPMEVRCMTLGSDGYSRIAKLTDHPDFEKWKDEMNPGEFWSTIGEDWVAKPLPDEISGVSK